MSIVFSKKQRAIPLCFIIIYNYLKENTFVS